MEDFTRVTLCGEIVERPDLSETEDGRPACHFWIKSVRRWTTRAGAQCEETLFSPCRGVGYVANSAKKYCRPGIRVLIDGYLRALVTPDRAGGQQTEMFVQVEHLAYLSPQKVAEACGRT